MQTRRSKKAGEGVAVSRRRDSAHRREAREELCPDRYWRFMLVYGNLKYPEELRSIEDCGVEVMHIGKVLE